MKEKGTKLHLSSSSLLTLARNFFSFSLSFRSPLSSALFLFFSTRNSMSSSSQQQPSGGGGSGEIESLCGLWSRKVSDDARSLFASFGEAAALDFLVEETKTVEQVVAGGVHEVRNGTTDGRGRKKKPRECVFFRAGEGKKKGKSFFLFVFSTLIRVDSCIWSLSRTRKTEETKLRITNGRSHPPLCSPSRLFLRLRDFLHPLNTSKRI